MDISKLATTFKREAVPVPEFDPGEPEAATLYVRNLTASERRAIIRGGQAKADVFVFDIYQLAYLGTVTDNGTGIGERTFPSATFLENLPAEYETAVIRLAQATLRISGLMPEPGEEDRDEVRAAKKK